MTSTQTFMTGKDQHVVPKLDGLTPSSTTSILLASTPPLLPRWYLTNSSGRHLLTDCQRSNPSKAVKSRKTTMRKMKWSWAEHNNSLEDDRWISHATIWIPNDKQIRQGRPVKRWRDDLDKYWRNTIWNWTKRANLEAAC